MRRYRARKRGATAIDVKTKPVNSTGRVEVTADGRVSARRPPDHFVDDGWYDLIADGEVTQAQAARSLETTEANVSRWFEWCRRQQQVEAEADEWEMGPEARRALDDFRYFRSRYFVAPRPPFKGKPFVTEPFHLTWIEAVLAALPAEAGGSGGNEGGQQVILSPPRHGKTMLLAHFVIWLILRNPDIAIIWIAKSETVAKETGSVVRDELERNVKLREEMLGPAGTFIPASRSGAAWRDDEFEVATRTLVQRAPTFRALGRGGTLQSVDADFIVTDDIEDYDSTRTPGARQSTREWLLTEVESRKEPHTAWLCIGSRNHPQDVLDHLLKSDDWQAIVETAHDHGCEQSEEQPELHVDCMLWPTKFPYKELRKKVRNSGLPIVSMRYLNAPQGDGMVIFTEALMRADEVLDRSRVLGMTSLPDGYELLGTIDPGAKHQIAEMWAWSRGNPVRYLIDLAGPPELRGGMDGWEFIVARWLETHNLRRWVVEDNALQSDYVNRREFAEWRQEHGVFVHGATTGRNKHSLGIGVASMVPLYSNKQIVLPYGDAETQGKVDAFIREHVGYDPDRTQRDSKWRIDRVMAAWFAHLYIDTLQGGRIDAETTDSTPSWLTPAGIGWVTTDLSEGWM